MGSRETAYVSLFSGGGGLDLGLEMAGFQAAYASDVDPAAVATLKTNVGAELKGGRRAFKDTFIEQANVVHLQANDILAKSGLKKGDVPLLAGGPPCQSWSSAGHQLGFHDPRGRLFDDFVRLANELDARFLLLENVRGLLTARGSDGIPGSALGNIRRALLDAGFQTTVALLNAADYGVPQRRVRLFMLGFRAGDAPLFPMPSHTKQAALLGGIAEWVPLSRALEAIGPLAENEVIRPTGKLAAELVNVIPGSGLKSPGKTERTRPGGHWGYKQGAFIANLSQPARTVTASTAQDWIIDPDLGLRRLCPRECASIQSFPSSWRFLGNIQAKYRLIGNAVPPDLAMAIGESLSNHISRQEQVSEPVTHDDVLPLPSRLAYHVRYTQREDASNGRSRREAPRKRTQRATLAS